MMKKVVLIAVIALLAFCSCKKADQSGQETNCLNEQNTNLTEQDIDLTEQVPQLIGSWQWSKTFVGGVVGYINADAEKKLVLVFEDNNKINIEYNDEIIVSGKTYSCELSDDSTYGNYLISLPKEVQSVVVERLGQGSIVIDGYIRIATPYLNDTTPHVVITDVEGKDMGSEGGSDFHCNSWFVRIEAKSGSVCEKW